MHRPAVRSAFGRGRGVLGQAKYHPRSTARLLSTTQSLHKDDAPKPTLRQRSAAAASELGQLRPAAPARTGPVDARALRASSPGQSPAGSNVINLRSLRGERQSPTGSPIAIGTPRRFPQGAGRFRNEARNAGPSLDNANVVRPPGQFRPRPSDRPARARAPGTGPPRRRTGGAGARQARPKRKPKRDQEDGKDDDKEKLVWSAEEQILVNNMEQGVVTPYTPEVTHQTLAGYGPAIATNNSVSQVERALRSMRILAGGRAFNSEVVYDDPRRTLRKYYQEKEPLFFDTLRQKDWLEGQRQGTKMHAAKKATRTAIVQSAILGKYEAHGPQFADAKNASATALSYLGKHVTYRPKDIEMFTSKLASLLPKEAPPKGSTPPRQKKAASA